MREECWCDVSFSLLFLAYLEIEVDTIVFGMEKYCYFYFHQHPLVLFSR